MPTIGRMGRTRVPEGEGITRRATPSPRASIQRSLGGRRQTPISGAPVLGRNIPPRVDAPVIGRDEPPRIDGSVLSPKPMPLPIVQPPTQQFQPMPWPQVTMGAEPELTQGPPLTSGGPQGFMEILNLIRQDPSFLQRIFGGLGNGMGGGGINSGMSGTPRMF